MGGNRIASLSTGLISATSTDAVNGSQLATLSTTASAMISLSTGTGDATSGVTSLSTGLSTTTDALTSLLSTTT
ncbi:hypothetical protein, partial [Burkholderia vietnamiensis]|uniref:hypothetical protein n=1 Tax=Burkholderia vietnamiensis TaxID=60552 RepID=UPI001E398552